MSDWLKELFGVSKPIIAMAHLPALPGSPRHNPTTSVDDLVEWVRTDIKHLLDAGVDGIMFANEDDRPYKLRAGLEDVAVLCRVVTELRPTDRPFGVSFLWDPFAALAVAAATNAPFMRGVIAGVFESDMGHWQPDTAGFYRLRHSINANHIRVMHNLTPAFSSPLGNRTTADRARSIMTSTLPDALLVSGSMMGAAPDLSEAEAVKAAIDGKAPVLMNTGAKLSNIEDYLRVADGVIVASSLKVDGDTWNPVDPNRARAFMNEVRRLRG